MRAVNIGDLKNNLSRYLNEVRQGSEVVIKDRNKPIAKIVPLVTTADDETELTKLTADGEARPPKNAQPLPTSFWRRRLPLTTVDLGNLIRKDRDAR